MARPPVQRIRPQLPVLGTAEAEALKGLDGEQGLVRAMIHKF